MNTFMHNDNAMLTIVQCIQMLSNTKEYLVHEEIEQREQHRYKDIEKACICIGNLLP